MQDFLLIVVREGAEKGPEPGASGTAEQDVRAIHRAICNKCSTEEMVRIIQPGLRTQRAIAALRWREGIVESLCCTWSEEFLEAGKKLPAGDTDRQSSLRDQHRASPAW